MFVSLFWLLRCFVCMQPSDALHGVPRGEDEEEILPRKFNSSTTLFSQFPGDANNEHGKQSCGLKS